MTGPGGREPRGGRGDRGGRGIARERAGAGRLRGHGHGWTAARLATRLAGVRVEDDGLTARVTGQGDPVSMRGLRGRPSPEASPYRVRNPRCPARHWSLSQRHRHASRSTASAEPRSQTQPQSEPPHHRTAGSQDYRITRPGPQDHRIRLSAMANGHRVSFVLFFGAAGPGQLDLRWPQR